MKKLSSIVVAALFVAVVVCLVAIMARSKSRAMAHAEVIGIVDHVHATRRIGADLSPDLRKVINKDPQYVLVCLVIEEAKRGWPGISSDDAKLITDKAVRNSAGALEDLQMVLRLNAQQKIIAAGHRPDENWDNNNTATAILFCYWPKAVEKGRQSQFVEEYLCGARDSWTSWMFN